MRFALHIFLALSIGSGLGTAIAAPDTVAEHEAAFRARMAEAGKKFSDAEKAESERFKKLLVDLAEIYQKKADLEGLVAVRDEVERFVQAGTVSEADLSENSKLRAIQVGAMKTLGKIAADSRNAELLLVQSYGRDLVELTRTLTKAGKIDAALQAQTQVEQLKVRVGELREGAPAQFDAYVTFEHHYDLSDLEALAKDWRWKAAFRAEADGLKAARGPANELETHFKMRGDFEVRLKFHFGQAQYTNTGGTWIKVCGKTLNITNQWGGFDANISVRRVGSKLIFDNRGSISEIELGEQEPTSFYLWWRSRSCHFKELSVSAQSVLRD